MIYLKQPHSNLLNVSSAAGRAVTLTKPTFRAYIANPRSTRFLHSSSWQQSRLVSQSQPHPTIGLLDESIRLYSSTPVNHKRNNNDEDQSPGFLTRVGNAIKSILPVSIFGSDEEKQKLARKKEVKKQVSGGIGEVLKDAPLGVRMLGRMIGPMIGNLASTVAEAVNEQQRTTEMVMEDAKAYLMADPAVTSILGEPINVGSPFSQSSATTSVNGVTRSRVELAMPVSGSRARGTIVVHATEDGISQILLDVGGRRIDVNLSKDQKSSKWSSQGEDNIIEAEIVDKKYK